MTEKLFEEILLDPKYCNQFLGVRVDIHDGQRISVIVASGSDPDEVHAQIRRDQHNRVVNTRYYFYKPTKDTDTREGWVIGGIE